MKRLTTEQFIEKAKNVFGNIYDYSKANYQGTDKPIDIICPKHGTFSITPHSFLTGHGCPACSNRQRIDTKVFISKATEKHNGRYDYSKVECNGSESLVKIICPIHGEFLQKASYHLNGNGCQKCFGTPKLTTEEFIAKAIRVYGEKYAYDKVKYQGNKTKICVTCKEHGDWWVTPNNFLRGSECPKCFGTPKYTNKQFIVKAKSVHGDKYDYSQTMYEGLKRKVKIICPIHGEFLQSPASHLKGSGCSMCNGKYRVFKNNGDISNIDKDIFIKRSKKNHQIEYDYSLVSFNGYNKQVCIICPTHGEFWQNPKYHMKGGDCPKCVGGQKLSTEDFIAKAKNIHGEKYDYSKVDYKNYNTKVCIICPVHGEFWQIPNNHLFGAGCPVCPQSNMEGEVRHLLEKHNILFEQEKSFTWLRYKKKMFLDFYLPEYNVAIECQGGQHFRPISLFGGKEFYLKTLERDRRKYDLCKEHGIEILYFSKSGNDYIFPVFESYKKLINYILAKNQL